MKVYETWLDVALQAAAEAADVLKQQWRQTHAVHWKGFRDIVTETDMAVEKIILGRLREAFPDHAVTSEEAGADAESAAVRWLVDPLDGTTNFSRNNPNFSTSIAAVDGDQVVVGVVLDPLRGHVFAARKGGGATLNGHRISVSRYQSDESVFMVYDGKDADAETDRVRNIPSRVRTMGCASLEMCLVAQGAVDAHYMNCANHRRMIRIVDIAASTLILREAGGEVCDLEGNKYDLGLSLDDRKNFLAYGDQVVKELVLRS